MDTWDGTVPTVIGGAQVEARLLSFPELLHFPITNDCCRYHRLSIVISSVAFAFFGHLNKRAALRAEIERKQIESADRWIDKE